MANSRSSAAPGQLGLVQSFLNTEHLETGRDDLADLLSTEVWLAEQRLVSPGTKFDDADRRHLVDVRGALHALVEANGEAKGETGGQLRAVTTLNEAARRVRLGVRLHPNDGYRLMAEGVGIDRPIGELLIAVTSAMAAGSWVRLKVCANVECQEAFYDVSKNHSGRWCSMAKCGNRAKGRAYRDRHNGVIGAEADDEMTEAAS